MTDLLNLSGAEKSCAGAGGGAVRGGSLSVAAEPVLAGARQEEVFGEAEFVSCVDLDGFGLDEAPALEGIHGVAGEWRCVAGSHFEAQIAGAEAVPGGFEVEDGHGHHLVGGQVFGGYRRLGR